MPEQVRHVELAEILGDRVTETEISDAGALAGDLEPLGAPTAAGRARDLPEIALRHLAAAHCPVA